MAASEGNEYTLGEIAGEGSFAEVFRAKDKHGNTVAVKRARVPLGYFGEATMTKAMKEFTTVKRLGEHPNIIQFLDIFKDSQGRLCIAMELAVGGSAKARMERKWGGDGRDDATVEFIFLPGDVAAVALDIASGLKFIHDQGLAHGDLKPGNIVFNAEGRALLADFGSAKLITEALSGQSGSTTSSTKEYDAPERLRFSPTSTASDIWSLGATLLELLTGCGALAKNPSTQQVLSDAAFCFAKGLEVDWSFSAALKALNEGPRAAWEAADQGLKDLIASCLVVDPGKRPTAAALLDTPLLRARRLEREHAELKELKALAAERALAVEKAEARAAAAEAAAEAAVTAAAEAAEAAAEARQREQARLQQELKELKALAAERALAAEKAEARAAAAEAAAESAVTALQRERREQQQRTQQQREQQQRAAAEASAKPKHHCGHEYCGVEL